MIKDLFSGKKLLITVLSLVLIVLDLALLIAMNVPTVQNYLNDTWEVKTSEVVNKGLEGEDYFKKEFGSAEEAQAEGRLINERILEEGTVMIKNENSALPLEPGSKLSVFGYVSTHIISGGTGSGGSGISDKSLLRNSLLDAGFTINEDLYTFYENPGNDAGYVGSQMDADPDGKQFKVGEVQVEDIPTTLESTYNTYDTALYVIGRLGGEGADLPRAYGSDSAQTKYDSRDLGKSALELTAAELDTLAYLQDNFDQVVVVINSSAAMELGFLEDSAYSNITAALIVGGTGENGINALGRILNGSVNPSGRLVDTYVYDLFSNPANVNFGSYAYDNTKVDGNNGHYVEYEEGIYVGYYYYETRGFTDGETWYNNIVQYPFGYGLSYTSFDYELVGTAGGSITSHDQEISLQVRVTNTGDVAGKEVVQLYYSAPYTTGGIEKPYVKLADFGKTDMLEPGESEVLTLTVIADAMSSYDDLDKNDNGFKGYELEAGDYELSIRSNSHQVIDEMSYTYTLDQAYQLVDSETHGEGVVNQFDDVSAELKTTLSRADWVGTWPTPPLENVSVADWAKALIEDGSLTVSKNPNAEKFEFGKELTNLIRFFEMRGVSYDDPKWDDFISQMTLQEALKLLGASAYSTQPIESIVKPKTNDLDGPVGIQTSFMGNVPGLLSVAFASEVTIAQTFNKQLAFEMGEINGELALYPDAKVSGWYAPGLNMHRSQFAGRNFEYYSEDPILSGMMGAEVTKGAQSKGLYVHLKHFALNDQETFRNGVSTWFNEQAAREVYLRPFEIAVRDGKAQAIMSAFNRLGPTWAGSSRALLTNILREEWGFVGMVKTDFIMSNNNYTNHQAMINAGGDVILSMGNISLEDTTSNQATQDIKQAVKNILYTTANSNVANGLSIDSVVIVYGPSEWGWYIGFLIGGIVVMGLALGGLGFNVFKVIQSRKKK